MAAPHFTPTDTGRRCPDPDLADTLADLQSGGVLIIDTPPALLGYCNAFADCRTAQAVVTIRTTGHERADATFTSVHDCCSGCLDAAVSADLRSGYAVEIHVPSHTAGVAA